MARQVDQQGAIDTRDLPRCQSGGWCSQTGSQLWFVPITLLTCFNLGFGQWRTPDYKCPFSGKHRGKSMLVRVLLSI